MTRLPRPHLLALSALGLTACAPAGPPERSSPELVPVEAPPPSVVPRWGDAEGGEGFAVWNAAGEPTGRAPDALAYAPFRSFDDGTVLVCGPGTLARWADGAWTLVPFPALPDLRGRGEPEDCEAFDAWSIDEALFVLGSGHLCRYDGADIACADGTSTVARDPERSPSRRGIQIAGEHAFVRNRPSLSVTELFVVERGAPPETVREIGSVTGNARDLVPVPGADQVVLDQDVPSEEWSPRVFGVDGLERVLDVDRELADGYGSLTTAYNTVPLDADDAFVVVGRNQVVRGTCTGPEDDPTCEILEQWSEIVVLRSAGGGAMAEVAHLRVSSAPTATRAVGVRVGDALRVQTPEGWLAIP